jgi:hypothetical protein
MVCIRDEDVITKQEEIVIIKMKYIINALAIITLLLTLYSPGQGNDMKILKISVLSSGKVLLNSKEITIAQLQDVLKSAKKSNGEVWYYRENGQNEPPPQAMQVIKLIIDNELPVTLSSKADFSDYINEHGESVPRN